MAAGAHTAHTPAVLPLAIAATPPMLRRIAPAAATLAALIDLSALPSRAGAQEAPEQGSGSPIRIFLDCQTFCDTDFLRTEIPFVDYVRDRQDADVHVLITGQGTGAGGQEITFQFTGLRAFQGVEDELRFSTSPTDADEQRRQGMARIIRAGLVPYLVRTPFADRLQVSLGSATGAQAGTAQRTRDPWNAWVFRVGVGGFTSGESSYQQLNWNASVNANRTTAAWKNVLSVSMSASKSETEVGERTVTNEQSTRNASLLSVKSISEHWSVGGRSNANRSTFLNRDYLFRVAPAIEYNFFPYSESTRRQLTLQYSVGANQLRYDQETIYGKIDQTLADQALLAIGSFTQRWGSVSGGVEAAHYFHDASKYHVVGDAQVELRLYRGLSLNFFGFASRVRDQLHLAAGELTPEQILLRQRQIATSFRYQANVNLSYSFGSVYSAVVNPRMRGGGGQF